MSPDRPVRLERAARDVADGRALAEHLTAIDKGFGMRARPVLLQRASELAEAIQRSSGDGSVSAEEQERLVTQAARYAGEVLAVYEGALTRVDGVDAGLCAMAERMLDEIAANFPQWRGLPVVLGAAESYTGSSGLVRLRFPTESIWGLPLVVHEHGHHVGLTVTELEGIGLHETVRSTIVEWADEEEAEYGDIAARSHLFELFADVYATWTIGPAYIAALTTLRLDPTSAYDGTQRHPPPDVRVTSALSVLRAMDRPDELWHPYRSCITAIEQLWQSVIGRRHGAGRRDFDTGTRRLSDLLDLCRRALADAQHDPGGVASWERGLRGADPLEPLPGDRVTDAVAALWRIRLLKHPDFAEIRRLEARALKACHHLVTDTATPGGNRHE